MISHDILFLSGEAQDKFLSINKLKEKFLDSPESFKLMNDYSQEAQEDKKVKSYIASIQDGVGVVNISGMLTNDDAWYNKYLGVLSYDEINRALIDLVENDVSVGLFNFDTPGGEGGRMLDIAELISSLPFPTIAHTSTSMSSAGYFLGCQADEVYANEMASVGSVGVYVRIGNFTEMYKKIGISFERFRSGDLKATGDPAFNLSKTEREFISNKVATLADKFYNIVSQARGIPLELLLDSEIPSGRTFSGREAVSNYLVDGIHSFEKSYIKALQQVRENEQETNLFSV